MEVEKAYLTLHLKTTDFWLFMGVSFINQWLSPLTTQGADISSSQHQEMILWLGEMNRLFHFCPETFALGVCVLNRLLSTVKVDWRPLQHKIMLCNIHLSSF